MDISNVLYEVRTTSSSTSFCSRTTQSLMSKMQAMLVVTIATTNWRKTKCRHKESKVNVRNKKHGKSIYMVVWGFVGYSKIKYQITHTLLLSPFPFYLFAYKHALTNCCIGELVPVYVVLSFLFTILFANTCPNPVNLTILIMSKIQCRIGLRREFMLLPVAM